MDENNEENIEVNMDGGDETAVTVDGVRESDLQKTMESYYIDYAMSVIVSRALPDVRDGLKPVQRRILYSMIELNNGPDKPHRKCARIVGDTMGKYHPHGDSSIYGALVNMAQDWSTRYTLVDGHGNFGSVDGDGAAAMRYTEARLTKMSMELLRDIKKDTVDFVPNFDETEKEPSILPSRFPNILVNGTTGIAVGMATNIPPHNLRETVSAAIKMIDNRINEDRETSIEELMEIVKGPDFPTGGIILGRKGIEEAYRTGKGKIRVRGITDIEPMANGKNRIVITELPYMVNKARLVEKIGELHRDKRVDGITALRDESDRSGMRVVVELRANVNPNVVLNQLYKHTQLQDTFGVNMLALVNNEPKILSLKDVLTQYLIHQEEVVTRRTQFDLNKAEERDHILQGLLKALDNIDEVIELIRGSANTAEAKTKLMERFGLSEAQAEAIVEMRLRALTGLEREKIEAEHKELVETIASLKAILGDKNLLLGVIRDEMSEIAEKFGDDRRTQIGFDVYDISSEDLIPEVNSVITMTNMGYIKRMTPDNFKSQNRGGRGVKGLSTLDDDYIEELFMTSSHAFLIFFTNKGRSYRLKGYEIPEGSRNSRGMAIINLLNLQPDEKISAVIPIDSFSDGKYMLMATKMGYVKRTPFEAFKNMRSSGLNAINLRDDDELIEVKYSDGERLVYMVSENGKCICFNEKDLRPQSRNASGVRGMKLKSGDSVVAMQLDNQGTDMLFVSEKGIGKRTPLSDFAPQNRGGQGLKCYTIAKKTGPLLGAKAVNEDNEVMLISSENIIIRMKVSDISVLSRSAMGVKLINLDEGAVVASVAKVREDDSDDEVEEAEGEAMEADTGADGSEGNEDA